MLVEPRPPHRGDAVARLQQRPHPLARAAAHETQMTAMLARQQLDNGGRFAMPPHAQHDAFVGPFHGATIALYGPTQKFRTLKIFAMASITGDQRVDHLLIVHMTANRDQFQPGRRSLHGR
jgi:uncharacterized membrane-anchored protein